MPSGLSDVLGYFHLSPVAWKTHLFLRCVFCQCWYHLPANKSIICSSFLLSCFYPALHCRGWESNLVLENATLLKKKFFFGDREEKGSWSKASEFTQPCLRCIYLWNIEILSVFQLMIKLGTIWNWLLMSICYVLFSLFHLQHFAAFCLSDL